MKGEENYLEPYLFTIYPNIAMVETMMYHTQNQGLLARTTTTISAKKENSNRMRIDAKIWQYSTLIFVSTLTSHQR